MNGNIDLRNVNGNGRDRGNSTYSTGNANGSPPTQPDIGRRPTSRARSGDPQSAAEQGLLTQDDDFSNLNSDDEDLDLPPAASRSPPHNNWLGEADPNNPYPVSGSRPNTEPGSALTARGAISQILNATSEDAGNLFNKLDENFLKPHLLLDPGGSSKGGHGGGG